MDEVFLRNRITKLRILKGVSEYQMSLDLGHSRSYLQSISSGRSLPSWAEFFNICDYLGIAPNDFFRPEIDNPVLISEITRAAERLSDEDRKIVLCLATRFSPMHKKA